MIRKSPIDKNGTITAKASAIVGLVMTAITNAKMTIKGARIAVRMIIIYASWTLLTSVVSLVTRLEVENLSTLEKEKSCTA